MLSDDTYSSYKPGQSLNSEMVMIQKIMNWIETQLLSSKYGPNV